MGICSHKGFLYPLLPSDVLPGRVYSEEIADIITDGCRKVVVILSPDYIESEWCSFAVKMAVHVSPGEGSGGEHYRRKEAGCYILNAYVLMI